jgi:hypothetical protein
VSGTTDKALRMFKNIYKVFAFLGKLGINTKKWMMRFDLMLNDIGLSVEELNMIKTDMRILYAEDDMIKEDHIIDIHRNIPRSSIYKVNKCSHLTIINNEEAIKDMKRYFEVK